MNVLVNTFYLDPSSESFFYSISFSLSLWFGITKKKIFYLYFFFDRNCSKAKVSLIAVRIDLLTYSKLVIYNLLKACTETKVCVRRQTNWSHSPS